MSTQFMVRDRFGRNYDKEFVVHETELLSQEARIALHMIEHWGIIAGKNDGSEDSSGRSMMKNMPPAEVVSNACEIASRAMDEFRKRGWIVQGPDISELNKSSTEEK